MPGWLRAVSRVGRLYLTVNDPGHHAYDDLPPDALVTQNPAPRGFAHNVNAALHRAFVEDDRETVCVVNFDLDMASNALPALVDALGDQPELGAVGAVLRGQDGTPTFSAGTKPSPVKEFLRASGLRSQALLAMQRLLLRRTRSWSARNALPGTGSRVLSDEEYLPWTCLAIRRRAYEDVGPLDERYPLYGEDIDWGLRCHQSNWKLGLRDCGPVVHFERATRGRRADSLYEFSHLELHRKWGWDPSLRWQQRGLRARRRWPLGRLTAPLDWSLLTNLDDAKADGASTTPDATSTFVRQLVHDWSTGRVACVTWLNHHSALSFLAEGLSTIASIDYVGIDGLFLNSLLGCRTEGRTSADQVLPQLLPLLRGARIALVGAERPSLDKAARVIRDDLIAGTGSRIVATLDGFAELPPAEDITRWLASCQPDVVIVGLGAVLQERWAMEVCARLRAGLVITCGGFLDQVHQPNYYPAWAYPLRLNWAVRVAREPRRLWHRYSV